MGQKIRRNFLILVIFGFIGYGTAQELPQNNQEPAQRSLRSQLEPVYRFVESFSNPESFSRIFNDIATWYRQQLAPSIANGGNSLLSFLPSVGGKNRGSERSQWNPFGMMESQSSGANDDIDLIQEIDTTHLDAFIRRLVDSLLPRPSPQQLASLTAQQLTTTKKPIIPMDHNNIGRRRFHAATHNRQS
ncbi:unnamed protein product [Bemisia tabaci]|uniref:Uncharacterized protein n=1 Tax=Bemisia tabaci TaxID=7038 RepID=A0A9P0AAG1_BEMTA|nr:unnamed protein product [Bemisia tabaci]